MAIYSSSSRNLWLTVAFLCASIFVISFYQPRTPGNIGRHPPPSQIVNLYEEQEEIEEEEEDLDILAGSETWIEDPELASAAVRFSDEPVISTDSKVAVIIELRRLDTLKPLILHFAAVLGPTWPIILYTSAYNEHYYSKASSFVRMEGQISVRVMPDEITFATHDSVSDFFTSPWLWEELAPAKHVLMFQADSIICANSPLSVDNFFDYDLIGAPIREGLGRGYNGGLSLRNREKILEIIRDYDWAEERHLPPQGDGYNYNYEDQWFAMHLGKMKDARLPTDEVAAMFSVETIWGEHALGFHQLARWQSSRFDEVKKWCPEILLTVGSGYG